MLKLDRVGKTYPNGVRALDGVSTEIAPGEILVVIGGSGCGKSTMLRAISGLDAPTQGRVVLDGAVGPRCRGSLQECNAPSPQNLG